VHRNPRDHGVAARPACARPEEPLKGSAKGFTEDDVNRYFSYEFPVRAGVAAALRRERVNTLGVSITTTFTGPDGETVKLSDHRGHTSYFDSYFRKTSGFDCRVRGISSFELTVTPTKAMVKARRKNGGVCGPNLGPEPDPPNDWE
jgi:hypothetical protein